MIKNLLIVCIGNICRSPMGEALFAHALSEKFPGVEISSAGIAAMVSSPADKMAYELMLQRGIDISTHRARQITSGILFGSDLILTMSTEQQLQIEAQYPGTRGRVHRLGKWGEYDIPDPYKRPQLIFEQALALIDQSVHEWCSRLWK